MTIPLRFYLHIKRTVICLLGYEFKHDTHIIREKSRKET